MVKLKFIGWEPGVRTISFTHLLQDEVGLSFKEAKEARHSIIDSNEIVEFDLPNIQKAMKVIEKARFLGVKCELVS